MGFPCISLCSIFRKDASVDFSKDHAADKLSATHPAWLPQLLKIVTWLRFKHGFVRVRLGLHFVCFLLFMSFYYIFLAKEDT